MFNVACKILLLSVVVGLFTPPALGQIDPISDIDIDRIASDQVMTPDAMHQVTRVSDLADVSPTDWSYQALLTLVERYRVIVGYPDRRFRGQRAMSRYEFAAGLNATLNDIDATLKDTRQQYATQEELAALKQLQAEFARELAVLKRQVGPTQLARTPFGAFSETTKLTGDAVVAATAIGATDQADGSGDPTASNLTVGSRVRLNLDTSFRGKDRLRTRLQAGNLSRSDRATGTDMARLAYQTDTGNALEISRLEYRTPIAQNTTLYVAAIGGSLNDFVNTFNPFLAGSGEGSISRFGQRNPIYRIGGGSGLGLEYEFTDDMTFSVGYLGDDISDPRQGFGQSAYSAIAQLSLELSKRFGIGFTYVRSFNRINTSTGSDRANNPFNDDSEAITADSFGIQAAIAPSRKLSFAGWAGLSRAKATDLAGDPKASIFNWAVTIALPDLFKEGSIAGVVIGQPPKLTRNDFLQTGQAFTDIDTSLHLEAFYRYQVNDFMSITPGMMIITNPEHNSKNDTIYIGTIRTTFSF
jgi:Carbohydrate-selective porin, OprB family/S-layer homology domain